MIGLLGLGSLEQHGPHLPPNTDSIIARHFVDLLLARRSDLARVAPEATVGVSYEHLWSTSTRSVEPLRFSYMMVRRLAVAAHIFGCKNFLLVNCHGGNRGALEVASRIARTDYGIIAAVANPLALSAGARRDRPDVHAGFVETSVMLSINSGAVSLNKIESVDTAAVDVALAEAVTSLRGVYVPWNSNDRYISSNGVLGDPRGASALMGDRIVDESVEKLSAVIDVLERFRG